MIYFVQHGTTESVSDSQALVIRLAIVKIGKRSTICLCDNKFQSHKTIKCIQVLKYSGYIRSIY